MSTPTSFREDADIYEALFELVPASNAIRMVLFKEWPATGARCVENIVEVPDSPRAGTKLIEWTSWIEDGEFRFSPHQVALAGDALKGAKTRNSHANRIISALKTQNA